MTKDEYKDYLSSDYWKGFTLAVKRERGCQCQDCGRKFGMNETYKLNLHHIVYKGVDLRKYNPMDFLVLCEDCHKKRHGRFVDEEPQFKQNLYTYDDSNDWSIIRIMAKYLVVIIGILVMVMMVRKCISTMSYNTEDNTEVTEYREEVTSVKKVRKHKNRKRKSRKGNTDTKNNSENKDNINDDNVGLTTESNPSDDNVGVESEPFVEMRIDE